jgi:hypothetical protein
MKRWIGKAALVAGELIAPRGICPCFGLQGQRSLENILASGKPAMSKSVSGDLW